MPNSFKDIADTLEDALDNVARSLRKAAESLSGEASDAVSRAAADVTRASESLRTYASATSKRAAHEVREHPIAVVAIIAGAAALVALILAATSEE